MKTVKTQWDGVRECGNFIIERREGGEWAVFEGNINDFFATNDNWVDTFPSMGGAVEFIEGQS